MQRRFDLLLAEYAIADRLNEYRHDPILTIPPAIWFKDWFNLCNAFLCGTVSSGMEIHLRSSSTVLVFGPQLVKWSKGP